MTDLSRKLREIIKCTKSLFLKPVLNFKNRSSIYNNIYVDENGAVNALSILESVTNS